MANYKKVAEQILSTVGGAENVASVTHCMTRLRFNLKDESLSNDEKLEDISSIISVVHAGGQVQLVVGPTVDKSTTRFVSRADSRSRYRLTRNSMALSLAGRSAWRPSTSSISCSMP